MYMHMPRSNHDSIVEAEHIDDTRKTFTCMYIGVHVDAFMFYTLYMHLLHDMHIMYMNMYMYMYTHVWQPLAQQPQQLTVVIKLGFPPRQL